MHVIQRLNACQVMKDDGLQLITGYEREIYFCSSVIPIEWIHSFLCCDLSIRWTCTTRNVKLSCRYSDDSTEIESSVKYYSSQLQKTTLLYNIIIDKSKTIIY
jgi:hypothetical protein